MADKHARLGVRGSRLRHLIEDQQSIFPPHALECHDQHVVQRLDRVEAEVAAGLLGDILDVWLVLFG